MEWEDIGPSVLAAWKELLGTRSDLFEDNLNEPTVCATFRGFLQRNFEAAGYVVDNNYNRMNAATGQRTAKRADFLGRERGIFPDIIVHKPRDNSLDGNLLVVEVKKYENYQLLRKDRFKLKALTSTPAGRRLFQYQFGLVIRYGQSGELAKSWLYQHGVETKVNPDTLLPED